jgi:hypothetical protein
MKTAQWSITLSTAALALALISLGLQIGERAGSSAADRNTSAHEDGSAADPAKPSPAAYGASATSVADEVESRLKSASAQLEARLDHVERGLAGVNQLIRSSGLDVAVPMWDPGPGAPGQLFEQIGKEAASRAHFESRRDELQRKAAESQNVDRARYGEARYAELEELYRKARPGRGMSSQEDRAARTSSLNRLVEEFPDAYATGVAVAEQALSEALDGNAGQVESYLQTLRESSQYTDIVTDQGVEAVPNIQMYLARQYLEQNRVDEAAALLDELSTRYPDSLIMEPNTGGPPSPPRTVQEVTTELRQRLGKGN